MSVRPGLSEGDRRDRIGDLRELNVGGIANEDVALIWLGGSAQQTATDQLIEELLAELTRDVESPADCLRCEGAPIVLECGPRSL